MRSDIKSLIHTIPKNGLLKVLIALIGLLYVSTFFYRYIQIDENFFAEQGYWLLNEGVVKLKSTPGVLNWDHEFLIYHKLLVWISATIIFLFGWSIYYFKVFTLVIFSVFLTIFWKFLKTESTELKWLALLIILSVPYVLIKSFEFRPEILMMTLTFGSFYAIKRYLHTKKYSLVALAGLLAGLAFLVHLNAVIACVAGALTLLFFKDIKASLLFSVVAIPMCFIYFYPLLVNAQLEQWLYNLKNWPSHSYDKNISTGVWSTLLMLFEKLLNEQKRFFWDDTVIGISVLFFTSLFFKGKSLWSKNRLTIVYLAILILSLISIGSDYAPRYLLLYLPFMVLTIAYSLENSNKFHRIVFIILCSVQFILLGNSAIKIYKMNRPYDSVHAKVMAQLSKTRTSIIAPWDFIFNEINNHDIYNYKTYEYEDEKRTIKLTQHEILEDLNNRKVEFVIIDQQMKNDKVMRWFKGWDIDKNPYFKEYSRDKDFLILKNYAKSNSENQ